MKNLSLKTRESYRHSSRRAAYVKILAGIGIGVFLVFMFGNVLGAFGSYLIEPVYVIRTWLHESSDTIPLYLRGRAELLTEMQRLREQMMDENQNLAVIERLQSENNELRSLMSFADEHRVAAGVIARPPYIPYDALLLDQGSDDGIRKDAIVYGNENVAIGYISRVFGKSSFVTLFSTSGVEGTAYIYGPNIFATLYGEGGGVLRLSVPQGIAVAEGDVVVLPSTESGIIGRISKVESLSTQPEQNAYVVQDVPMQSLRFVSISSRVIENVSYEEAVQIVEEHRNDNLRIEVPVVTVIDSDFATSTATSTTEIELSE